MAHGRRHHGIYAPAGPTPRDLGAEHAVDVVPVLQ